MIYCAIIPSRPCYASRTCRRCWCRSKKRCAKHYYHSFRV